VRAGFRSAPTWKRPARKRRNRRILAAALAALTIAVLAPPLSRPVGRLLGAIPLFRVGGIEIAGLLYLSPEEARAEIPVAEGDNLLFLEPSRVEAALRLHPRIEDARVSRGLGRLCVRIRERRTFLLVNAGTLLEVDSSGTILPPLARGLVPDRPVLTGVPFPTLKPGARVTTARLREVLRLVALLESPEVGLVSEISEIAASERSRVVLRTSRDQIPILVDPPRVTVSALRAVSATLRDVRDRARPVVLVDARYRRQVVVRCSPDSARAGDTPAPARERV
jgi:cell division septal protein FtsQ